MPQLLSRATWTSSPRGFPRLSSRLLDPADIEELVPHYPAAGDVTYGPSPTLEQSAAQLRAWRKMHIEQNGWADLGYPYAIDQAGRGFVGAGDTHAAAHAGGHNRRTLGVLFIVGDNEEPTPAARATFRALGSYLQQGKFPNMRPVPRDHGRLPGQATSCAGQPIRRNIDAGLLTFGPESDSGARPAGGGSYQVQAGDTLTRIAAAAGTTVPALVEANGLGDANLIRVGQQLQIPTAGGSAGGDGTRAAATRWPARPLPQIFLARSSPFSGAAGVPLDNWFRVVPADYSAALFEYIRRAGFTPTSSSKWGHEELLRQWLLESHRQATQRADVLRHGNRRAFGNAASIWAGVQAVLAGEGLYGGQIDAQPGPATWWALVQRMNGGRSAYL